MFLCLRDLTPAKRDIFEINYLKTIYESDTVLRDDEKLQLSFLTNMCEDTLHSLEPPAPTVVIKKSSTYYSTAGRNSLMKYQHAKVRKKLVCIFKYFLAIMLVSRSSHK